MTPPMLAHIDEVMSRCIRCGLCLPVCPTYELTGDERSSPRGRIRLFRALHDGSPDAGAETFHQMYFCLDCQACETACPAGVRYGELVEDARRTAALRGKEPRAVRRAKRILLGGILGSRPRTRRAAALLRLYTRSGLRDAVDASGILTLVSARLAGRHRLLPRVDGRPFDEEAAAFLPAAGRRRGRVALVTGCIMNVAFARIHDDTVQVLRRNGFDVVIPRGQHCCGALHAHYGDDAGAGRLANATAALFGPLEVDAVVVNAAGCSAFMKHYGGAVAGPHGEACAEKVFEVTEFLAKAGFERPRGRLNLRVTYHEPCHLVHAQKISRQPREILGSIPGLQLTELAEATWCCGSAGMYNVIEAETSGTLLERKVAHILATGAQVVATGNPGCHLQLEAGLRPAGISVRHPVSLLADAYRGEA